MRELIQHLWLTLVPWLIGIVLGGSLGHLVAFFLRRYFETYLSLRTWLTLLPWRTSVAFMLLMAIYSPQLLRYFGLGFTTALIKLSIVSFTLSLTFTIYIFLVLQETPAIFLRLVSVARTMAVAMAYFAITAVDVGAGGAGVLINDALVKLDSGIFFDGVFVVVLVSVVFDVLIGVIQILVSPKPRK